MKLWECISSCFNGGYKKLSDENTELKNVLSQKKYEYYRDRYHDMKKSRDTWRKKFYNLLRDSYKKNSN